jgi:GH15 family glucan-1,4-alpha-glucosidase
MTTGGYSPIESYAAIGDCHGSALVGRDGNIEWCALKRFDAPPVFLRILDAEKIRQAILGEGVDPKGRFLRQAFDGGVDAAVLLAPMLGFPLDDDVLANTINMVEERLARGEYLLRYDGADGLGGEEGAFLACSFWLIDAKVALGQVSEATVQFEKLIARANDVGLFAEEIDPASGAFLGNFPQAFTHLTLIGTAVNLDLAERYGARAARDSHAARARRAVGSPLGGAASLPRPYIGVILVDSDRPASLCWHGHDALRFQRATPRPLPNAPLQSVAHDHRAPA